MATAVNTSTQQYFGFDPRTIPGCVLWLDGADRNVTFSDTGGTTPATLGGTVARWNDKSGFGNHTTNRSGTTTLTASAINGVPALSFASSWFTGGFSSTYTGNQLRAFAVATLASASGLFPRIFTVGRPGIDDFNQTDTTFLFIRNNGGQNLMVGRNSSYLTVSIPAYSTPFLVQAGHSSNIESIGVNGVLSPSTQNTGVAGNFNITSYGIGTNTNTADINNFIGLIGEIVYYTENLTTAQIQQVEGYLAWKWGLQANLPTGHPFRPNPTTMRVFQPIDIDSCVLWLDAADLSRIAPANITSGTAITSWSDKSTSATSAIPQRGVSGVAPVFSNVGGVPSIFINNGGVDANYNASTYAQLQVQSNIQTTADYSVFAVVNLSNVSSAVNQTIYSNNRGTDRAPQLGPGSTFEATSTGTFRLIAAAFPGTGIRQTSLVSTLASFIQLQDGAAYASVISNLPGRFAADADPLPTIGGTFTASGVDNRFTTGHFHEIIVYNKALTTSERQQVEGYLAQKWKTPALPTTQPYYLERVLPSTPVFTPAVVSNLQVWLDGADPSVLFSDSAGTTLVGASGNVGLWRDKSPFARDYTQATSGNRPTFSNNTVATTDNTRQALSNASITLQASGVDLFFVGTPLSNTPSRFRSLFRDSVPSDNALLMPPTNDGTNPTTLAYYTGGATRFFTGITLTGLARTLIHVTYPVSRIPSAALNGTSALVTGPTALTTNSQFNNLGGRPDIEQPWGAMNEVILVSTVSRDVRQQIEGYLAWKWGLQNNLPTTHPYYRFRP